VTGRTDVFLCPMAPRPSEEAWSQFGGGGSCLPSMEILACVDGATRKVGLKELWTLKWHRQYDTANCWTKAGGVQPGDWPEWMRQFKDY